MTEKLSLEESQQKVKAVDALFKNFVLPESEKEVGTPLALQQRWVNQNRMLVETIHNMTV